MTLTEMFQSFVRDAEGEGGGGGVDKSMFTPGDDGGATGDDKGATGDDKSGEWTGPDFIAEKYRGAENPMEAQAQGYAEAMKLVTRKSDEIRTEIEADLRETITKELKDATGEGVPENAEDYAYPEGLEAPGEETDKAFKEWAKENGISQEAFETLSKMYAAQQPDLSAEREKLGDNADARIAAMNAWGSKNIPESLHDAAQAVMATAAGFELIEHFMGASRDAGYSPKGGTPAQPLTAEQITTMQNDPRYWQEGKIDPAYQRKVEKAWADHAKRNPG